LSLESDFCLAICQIKRGEIPVDHNQSNQVALLKYFLKTLPFLVVAAVPSASFAQNMAKDLTDVVRFELLPGWRQNSGSHMIGVRISLEDGWNTYWRIRGSSGIPPRFSLDGSENVSGFTVHWPRPEVFDLHGERIIGYLNQIVLPVEIMPVREGEDISLKATLELGVCSEMCMPVKAEFSASLDDGGDGSDPHIDAALATVPRTIGGDDHMAVDCKFKDIENGSELIAVIDAEPVTAGEEIAVVEYPNPDVWIPLPKTNRQGGVLEVRVKMINYGGQDFTPDPKDVRITLIGPDQALDFQGCTLTSG